MKRSLVVLLTIAMLLFAFAGVATAAEQDDAAQRLQDFNIIEGYEDGSLGLDREITRAEFAKIAVMAKGMEEAAELLVDSSTPFSDVKTGVWYTGWINVAYSQNIIQGDPAGTFRPNDNISNAEAVAMILRVLGYGENLPGVWPNNYLVKGAELGVTTGIVSNASAKAVRGDVFTMLNRALDEEVVKWDSDEAEYVERKSDGKSFTLLQEMLSAKEEVTGWVTDNFRTDEKLKENEIKIDGIKYKLMIDYDVDWLLGLEVTVKHDDKDVYYVEVETDDEDIIFDLVSDRELEDGDVVGVTLKVEDDDFDVVDNAKIFVNYDSGVLNNDMYGKFVLDDGDIVFAVVFDFDEYGVVTEIDDEIYEFVYEDAGNVEELDVDFDEYDEIVVLDKELKVTDADIEVGNVIYVYDDGDDTLYVVLANETVSGTLERLRENNDRLVIDGSTYKKADGAVVTTDDGDDFVAWSNVTDLLGEEVVVSLDLLGYAMLVSGDSEATSGAQYGIITWFEEGRNPVVSIFTADGKEVEYGFETRSDANILYEGEDLAYDFRTETVLVKYKLNKDGEIADGEFNIEDSEVVYKKVVDRRYIETVDGEERLYISSSTVFFKSMDDGEIDPSVLKYDDIYATAFDEEDAVVIANANNEIKAIAFTNEDFEGVGDDSFYGIVIDKPWQDKDNWYAEIDVFGEGVKEYKLDNENFFAKGNIVEFIITSSDKAKAESVKAFVYNVETGSFDAGKVTYRDGQFIKVDGGPTYKIASGAVIYEYDFEDETIGDPLRVSRITAGTSYIVFMLDENNEIVAAIVDRYGEVEDL